jgi:hypothetical protein
LERQFAQQPVRAWEAGPRVEFPDYSKLLMFERPRHVGLFDGNVSRQRQDLLIFVVEHIP